MTHAEHRFALHPSIVDPQRMTADHREEYGVGQIETAITSKLAPELARQVHVTRADCYGVTVTGSPDAIEALVKTQAGNASWFPVIPHAQEAQQED